jgi:hypothetical protein
MAAPTCIGMDEDEEEGEDELAEDAARRKSGSAPTPRRGGPAHFIFHNKSKIKVSWPCHI